MHYKKLDLNLLVALNVLLRERSVTRAAEYLYLSPSSASQALSRLRDYFQDELLVQVGRRMDLTPRAMELRDSLPQLFMNVDAVLSPDAHFDPTHSHRTFRIYASDYVLAVLAPHLFRLAREKGFAGRIDFLPQRAMPSRELQLGHVDFVIVPSTYRVPEHPSELLYEERFVCIVGAGSALAQGSLTLDRYQHARHVVMQLNIAGHEPFDAAFVNQSGAHRQVVASSYSFSSLASLVAGTDTIATVQLRLARHAQRAWPIEIKESPVPMAPMQQLLQWHGARSNDAGLLWLRGVFAEAVVAMDAPPPP